MRLISHRGNIHGRNPKLENLPNYIDNAIKEGYDVEVDLWYAKNTVKKGYSQMLFHGQVLESGEDGLYLGHDYPQYKIEWKWLKDRKDSLWVHCKNIEALKYAKEQRDSQKIPRLNYFWHETDTVTLTSNGYIWAYPSKQPIPDSIAVLPEIHNESVDGCWGVCSDDIKRYSK